MSITIGAIDDSGCLEVYLCERKVIYLCLLLHLECFNLLLFIDFVCEDLEFHFVTQYQPCHINTHNYFGL